MVSIHNILTKDANSSPNASIEDMFQTVDRLFRNRIICMTKNERQISCWIGIGDMTYAQAWVVHALLRPVHF